MTIIEPHIHILSRTTDDLQAIYENGIRACVEPSFWLGSPRRYAGTFWDYFQHILEFETVRARRFGIDHYACVAVNPKEADNHALAEETLAGIGPYLDHPRCLAVGEIGYNLITANEERVFQRQLEMAKARNMLILIHTPHDTPTVSKKKGVERTIAVCRELRYDWDRILIDHNTEETMQLTRDSGAWAGMTVYPYSKLNPERCVGILKKWGLERTWVNSSADWGASDPLSLVQVAGHMKANGFQQAHVERLLFDNPLAWYRQSGRFEPDLDIPFIHPREYQR